MNLLFQDKGKLMNNIERNIYCNIVYVFTSIILSIYMSYSIYKFSKEKKLLLRSKIISFILDMYLPTFISALTILSSIDICKLIFGDISFDDIMSFWLLLFVFFNMVVFWIYGIIWKDRKKVLEKIKERDIFLATVYEVSFIRKEYLTLKPLILSFSFVCIPIILLFCGTFMNFYLLIWIGAPLAYLDIIFSVFIATSIFNMQTDSINYINFDLKRYLKIKKSYFDGTFMLKDNGINKELGKWFKKNNDFKIQEKFVIYEKNLEYSNFSREENKRKNEIKISKYKEKYENKTSKYKEKCDIKLAKYKIKSVKKRSRKK